MIFLLFVAFVTARFNESFDSAMLANGTANALLGSGARIVGNATTSGGQLVLTRASAGLSGSLLIPAQNGSALGWTVSFDVRLSTSGVVTNATGVGLRLNWGSHTFHAGNSSVTQSSVLSCIVDTSNSTPGFFVRSSSTAIASKPTPSRIASANGTFFVVWNPLRGVSFRTSGFAVEANVEDARLTAPPQADALSWSIVSTNGALLQEVAIDNVVVATPCADCRALGNICEWGARGHFACLSVPATACVNNTRCLCASAQSCDGGSATTFSPPSVTATCKGSATFSNTVRWFSSW